MDSTVNVHQDPESTSMRLRVSKFSLQHISKHWSLEIAHAQGFYHHHFFTLSKTAFAYSKFGRAREFLHAVGRKYARRSMRGFCLWLECTSPHGVSCLPSLTSVIPPMFRISRLSHHTRRMCNESSRYRLPFATPETLFQNPVSSLEQQGTRL